MTPSQHPSIFVSATSRGLRSLRTAAADHLKARKFDVVVQEEFDCDYQKIKDMIRDKVAPCDAVVLLVGPAYGFEPTDWPSGVPRCSYTQLEYELAVELKKPVYRFIASANDTHTPYDPEPAEHQQRQRAYIQRLKAQDHVWYEFGSPEQLLTLLEKTRFHKLVTPNLPFDSIGTLFKGRDEALASVRQSLLTRPAHATAVTSKQAIHGLGGVGKTRFAIEYAHRFASEYSARLYANADTPSAFDANTAALCGVLDLPEQHEKEQPKQLEAVQRWLRTHAGWLLILDNVDTPEAQTAVNAAFKNLTSGHVLITSRLTDWGSGVNAVELDTLGIPASTEFLLERTAGRPDAPTGPRRQPAPTDPTDAAALATDLGGLALALEQAGAYICANRITFAVYRTRLTEIERDVLKWFDADVMKYPKSVAVTWQASVNQLYPDGRALLNLLAWLAPDPIPVALIRTEPKEPPHVPITNRERALKDLADYSLAKWGADGRAVTVHRLVQDVTRTRASAATGAVHDALEVVYRYTRAEGRHLTDPAYRGLWDGVVTHAEAVVDRSPSGPASAELLMIVNNVAHYRAFRGQYRQAEELFATVLGACQGDPTAAPIACTALNNLAEIYRLTNRPTEAKVIYERLLEQFRSEPDALTEWSAKTRSNLGLVHMQLNQPREARLCFEAAVKELESLPDERPVELALFLSNLGTACHALNDRSAAAAYLGRALALEEKHLGPSSPAVARSLNNLAYAAAAEGRIDDAERMLFRALTIYEEQSGRDHPDVISPLVNIAELYRESGRSRLAEPLYRRVIAVVEAGFDPLHPLVTNAVNGLAIICQEDGRHAEAERHYTRALEILYRFFLVSRHKHPHWDSALENLLAFFLKARGMSQERAFEAIAEILRRVAREVPDSN